MGSYGKDQAPRPGRARSAGSRTAAKYTVEQCLKDWPETLNTQADSTVTGYQSMVRHLVELIGNVKLVDPKVRDVDFALGKLAKRLSTRSVRLARMILVGTAHRGTKTERSRREFRFPGSP